MADTATGQELTAQQRATQIALRAKALSEFLKLWPLLDPARLDTTAAGWIGAVLDWMQRHKPQSATAAGDYYRAYRAAETGELVPPKVALVRSVNVERARTGLIVTGPVQIKHLTGNGASAEQASAAALQSAAGTAVREVLAGGRETIVVTAERDRMAIGFARVTDGDPCYFCALLASRGPVYKTADTATSTATGVPYHSNCACTAEPVFRHGGTWPGQAREWRTLYEESTAGLSGKAAVRAFRRAYEGRTTERPATATRPEPGRRRQLESEIAALERTFAGLQARKDRGEDPGKPYDWQRNRLASLRTALADLPN